MNLFKKMNKKGVVSPWVIGLLIFGIFAVIVILVVVVAPLAVPVVPVVVEYDGEFDDAYLAEKGFYSDFTEGTDCNITSDVLGASGYSACIYETQPSIGNDYNSTEYRIDLVIDIDGDVENLEIEGKLQNTDTGQAKDDMIIKEAELWTYEDADETILVYSIPIDNEDGQFEGETGVLAGDDYVLHIVLKTKLVLPAFTDGDNIMLIDLDLTTDGDVDSARITLEES